jgi:hypothetical protein
MPKGEEDGYSLEGFDVPHVTLEVAASQIIPIAPVAAGRNNLTQITSAIKIEAAAIGRLSRFSLAKRAVRECECLTRFATQPSHSSTLALRTSKALSGRGALLFVNEQDGVTEDIELEGIHYY